MDPPLSIIITMTYTFLLATIFTTGWMVQVVLIQLTTTFAWNNTTPVARKCDLYASTLPWGRVNTDHYHVITRGVTTLQKVHWNYITTVLRSLPSAADHLIMFVWTHNYNMLGVETICTIFDRWRHCYVLAWWRRRESGWILNPYLCCFYVEKINALCCLIFTKNSIYMAIKS